jgi:uncharacterized protein (DUF697 family)
MSGYLDTLERVMKGDFQDASDQDKADAVRDVIQVCSVASAAVAWQPIPFVDTILISPIQIALVQAIGRIHGYKLDQKSVVEILGTFGASLLAQNVIMAAAKLIPFAGWIVGMSMAYALTYAVGEVSDHYFRNGRGVDQQDLKEMFDKTYKSKKAEKQAEHRSDGSLKDRLEQLKEAFAAGLLTEEEFEAKKQELLAGF